MPVPQAPRKAAPRGGPEGTNGPLRFFPTPSPVERGQLNARSSGAATSGAQGRSGGDQRSPPLLPHTLPRRTRPVECPFLRRRDKRRPGEVRRGPNGPLRFFPTPSPVERGQLNARSSGAATSGAQGRSGGDQTVPSASSPHPPPSNEAS